MINLLRDINTNTIYYKIGQTWAYLTGMDPIIAFFYGRREYTNTDDKHDNKHTRLMNTVSNLRTLAAMTICMDTCIK